MVLGSRSISENNTWLVSYFCPADTFGVFLMGAKQAQIPFGNGTLCIEPFDSMLYRLLPAGLTDPLGGSILHLDFEQGIPATVIQPGTTWNFQCYFRDIHDVHPLGFNLTNAVSALFTN